MIFNWFRKKKYREFVLDLMSATAEGEKKAQIRRAISTLKKIEAKDETQYSGFAACELALAVIKRAGVSSPTHDDLYTGGVFVFIIANHISYILEARFESAATLGVMAFLASNGMSVEDASLSIDPISQTYNNMASSTANDGKYNLVVGQHVANWCNTPSEENFNKLVELYNLGRKFLG